MTSSVIFGLFWVSASKRAWPGNAKPARENVPLKRCPVLRKRYMYREHKTKQSGSRDEGGSERRNLDESKRVERVERNLKSQVGEFKFLAFLKTMQSLRVFQRLLTCWFFIVSALPIADVLQNSAFAGHIINPIYLVFFSVKISAYGSYMVNLKSCKFWYFLIVVCARRLGVRVHCADWLSLEYVRDKIKILLSLGFSSLLYLVLFVITLRIFLFKMCSKA